MVNVLLRICLHVRIHLNICLECEEADPVAHYALFIMFIIWLYLPAPIEFGRNPALLLCLEVLWIPTILYILAAAFAAVAYYAKRKKALNA